MTTTAFRLISLALIALCIGSPATAANSQAKDIVELPSLTIYGSWVEVAYFAGKDGKIEKVDVIEVTKFSPPAEAGLRRGDELVSVAGMPVAGMSVDAFADVYASPVPQGSSKVYEFRGRRGVFTKSEKVFRFAFAPDPKPTKS